MKLAQNMAGAWIARAESAAQLLRAAGTGLVKSDTIEQARRDYYRALAEVERWSA